MAQLAIKLSETAPMRGRAVAPIAEWVAETLWSRKRKPSSAVALPSRLTQRHRREAKGGSPLPSPISPPRRDNLCRGCGKTIEIRGTNCAECAVGVATERLNSAANLGRIAARSPEARAKHVVNRKRHAQACSEWTHRSNRLGSQVKYFRKRSSRCSRTFQQRRFEHELASRVGTLARSGRASVLIPGTGRQWRSW
jgi:hypothetical protein